MVPVVPPLLPPPPPPPEAAAAMPAAAATPKPTAVVVLTPPSTPVGSAKAVPGVVVVVPFSAAGAVESVADTAGASAAIAEALNENASAQISNFDMEKSF